MTRHEVLGQAVDQCMKELYSFAQPSINWDDFIYENKTYQTKEKGWHKYRDLIEKKDTLTEEELLLLSTFPNNWENKSIKECIGPRPYEYYYLPKEIMEDICNSYIHAYNIDSQQQLLDIIKILKNYCKEPIVDKYIKEKGKPGDKDWEPGHRGYEYPDNLEKALFDLIPDSGFDRSEIAKAIQDKFFEFLDMAGNFYNWNWDLNSFNMSVYLGASPNSNKEAVIENWKKYKGVDIEIDEEKMKKEYYGEED